MTTAYPMDPKQLGLDTAKAKEIGASFAERYQSAEPFHHICIDNFLPMEVIESVRADLASLPDAERAFDAAEEKLKSQFNPDRLPEYSRHLFQSFNSRHFILFLEEMTGIKGLIPDPYFIGAGIHKTLNGGYLNIHADFNVHGQMKLERRLNLLIYLNPPWKEEWGGSFEVWDKPMQNKVASFAPTENRMCCFSTGSDTWDESRLAHSTLFKPRPGTEDARAGVRSKIDNAAKELLPPMLYRTSRKVIRRLGI